MSIVGWVIAVQTEDGHILGRSFEIKWLTCIMTS